GILQSKLALAKADHPSLAIPDPVLEFLARKIESNARDLEGALNRLVAEAVLVRSEITLESAQDLLRDMLRSHERRLSIEDIQQNVAAYYKLKVSDLLSARRSRVVARPRQVAMYLCKTLTPASLPEIGRQFGKRDHTTVLHAVRKIDALMKTEQQIAADVDMLRRILSS
ncbi:MAG: helix-turn-helix domain-containing protein, partial [Pseudomonadota bacterium]